MDASELKSILQEVLNDHREVDNTTHAIHHKFVEMCMEREERKREMWEKIKAQVGGWVIIGTLGAIGAAVWNYFFKGN